MALSIDSLWELLTKMSVVSSLFLVVFNFSLCKSPRQLLCRLPGAGTRHLLVGYFLVVPNAGGNLEGSRPGVRCGSRNAILMWQVSDAEVNPLAALLTISMR